MHTDYSLDLRREVCPLTFVKARLLIEKMIAGQTALLLLSEGEALYSLPVSIQEYGCIVQSSEKVIGENYYSLILQKI